jgi:OOP family OmpA-OmpF porin
MEGGLMKHVAKSLLAAGATAVCCFAAPAHAQLQFGRMDTSLYIGGAVGGSRFKHGCEDVPVSCDRTDTAWKAFVGYQFTPNIGIEAGYVDMGKVTANGPFGGGFVDANAKVRGVELVAVGTYPITNQFAVYGKLGAIRSRVSVSSTAVLPGFAGTLSDSARTTDFTFGLGARYFITQNLGARAEWQRYQKVGNDRIGTDDIDVFSLGLLYAF